jgi:hypothetical protein
LRLIAATTYDPKEAAVKNLETNYQRNRAHILRGRQIAKKVMLAAILLFAVPLLVPAMPAAAQDSADGANPEVILGYFELQIASVSFQPDQWERVGDGMGQCETYKALAQGAWVVVRVNDNRVPGGTMPLEYKASQKDLKVTACGATVRFDKGFVNVPLRK